MYRSDGYDDEMVSKIEEARTKATMHTVMSMVNEIGRLVTDKNFAKAHDLRDKLFSYVVEELIQGIDRYTKRDIEEFLNVLQGVDDWGL